MPPLLAVEGAQHRLGLGKLHHALAGIGGMLVEGLVGVLVEAGGEQEDRHQQRQGDQGDEAELHIEGKQGHQHHQRGDHPAEQGGEDVGRQLGQLHHALRGQVVEAGCVGRGEPADGQAAHVLAQGVAAGAQHRDPHGDASLFHPAAQVPAEQHADQLHQQPAGGGVGLGAQQVCEHRDEADQGQAAEQAVEQGQQAVAAQQDGVVAEQAQEGVQHVGTAS